MRNLLLITLLAQIIAGSPEDKAFQQVMAEADVDAKLQRLVDFEKTFPKSKALPGVYVLIMDVYRQKDNADKIIEYGEKVLTLDSNNVTAMMALSRHYAIKRINLDRAVELAQKAVDQVGKMRAAPPPVSHTDAQWKSYLDSTETAARNILAYSTSVRGN